MLPMDAVILGPRAAFDCTSSYLFNEYFWVFSYLLNQDISAWKQEYGAIYVKHYIDKQNKLYMYMCI